MTFCEAAVEVWMGLGMSRETAELRAKFSDAFVPDACSSGPKPDEAGQN